MRNVTVAFLILSSLFTIGCDWSAATEAGSDRVITIDPAVDRSSVPFRTSSYTFQNVGVAPEPGCDNAGENRVRLSGKGTATHLGSYTVALSFCSRPNATLVDGRGSFAAANGDLLHFTFDGTSAFIPPFTLNFSSFAVFAGGTGRFEDASGQATVTGSLDVRTGAGEGAWEGTVSR